MEEKVIAYKGFNKDLTCRGFQYEIGKEHEEVTTGLTYDLDAGKPTSLDVG